MLKLLSQMDQLAFAELVDKSHDAAFDAEFPANGSFLRQARGGRRYWYYRGYQRTLDGSPGSSTLKYVGLVGDPEIERRIEKFGSIKSDYRGRRDLAAKLRRAGLPAPTAIEGRVVQALAQAGVFRLRAALVGSVAYQSYAGLLGVRFQDAQYRTADVDLAQDHGVSVALDDRAEPIESVLKSVDPTFSATEHWQAPNLPSGYRNAAGFKVEFLTTIRGKAEHQDRPAKMPALGGVGAQPLPFMDFLIREPVRSVLLHDAGVGVIVPDPARYAVHKLIVASRRENRAKIGKDLSQSATLIAALGQVGRATDLGLCWLEAFDRGPSWRRALSRGALGLQEPALEALRNAVLGVEQREDGREGAAERPFSSAKPARETLTPFLASADRQGA